MSDKIIHGTTTSKLTERQVRSIRALKGKMTHQKIAELFGIARGTVSNIQLGKKWAWLN